MLNWSIQPPNSNVECWTLNWVIITTHFECWTLNWVHITSHFECWMLNDECSTLNGVHTTIHFECWTLNWVHIMVHVECWMLNDECCCCIYLTENYKSVTKVTNVSLNFSNCFYDVFTDSVKKYQSPSVGWVGLLCVINFSYSF